MTILPISVLPTRITNKSNSVIYSPIKNLSNILNSRIQDLAHKKEFSTNSLNNFINDKNLLTELQKESREINKNAVISFTTFQTTKTVDLNKISKFNANKLTFSTDVSYKTGDEVSLSYIDGSTNTYFVKKINDKDIALYDTKEHSLAGGSSGRATFSEDQLGSVGRLEKETHTVETKTFKETDKFKELHTKLKKLVGNSPFTTNDFANFDSKLSNKISDIGGKKIVNVEHQIQKINDDVTVLQNAIKKIAESQVKADKQISFISSLGSKFDINSVKGSQASLLQSALVK